MNIIGVNQDRVMPKRTSVRRMVVESAADRQQQNNNERRRRPDRRQRQVAISMADRRMRRDRRTPKLLNPQSADPEKISSQKGRTIDTKV